MLVCSKYSKDFGLIYGIRKPKASTLLLCVEVLADRKIKHEKRKTKVKNILNPFISVSVFRTLKSIGSEPIDRTKFVHIPIERAQEIL